MTGVAQGAGVVRGDGEMGVVQGEVGVIHRGVGVPFPPPLLDRYMPVKT